MNIFLGLLLFLHIFPSIDETIPSHPFCYPGICSREVICVDPDHCPLLQSAIKELEPLLSPDQTEEEILSTLLDFVSETLFHLELCTTINLNALIQKSYSPFDEIPLDYFLAAKTGVCRHLALTSTYLAHHLVKTGWLHGEAYLIRDELPSGRHAWTLFISDEGAWHLDPTWKILENGKTRAGFFHLCQKYGKRTMERQETRWKTN